MPSVVVYLLMGRPIAHGVGVRQANDNVLVFGAPREENKDLLVSFAAGWMAGRVAGSL